MKKILSVILAGVLCLSCLTACGGNTQSSSSAANSSAAALPTPLVPPETTMTFPANFFSINFITPRLYLH